MLTLTSPIDNNVSTTGVLVLVTKDSFVSLVTIWITKQRQCL